MQPKKLLKIPRLGNIKDLETAQYPNWFQKLLGLSPGGNELVKLAAGRRFVAAFHICHRIRSHQATNDAGCECKTFKTNLEEEEMKSWQNLIRVLTHEIMNSITPIASLSSTAYGLLKDNRECEVPGIYQ